MEPVDCSGSWISTTVPRLHVHHRRAVVLALHVDVRSWEECVRAVLEGASPQTFVFARDTAFSFSSNLCVREACNIRD
jgi:hypothetical protein